MSDSVFGKSSRLQAQNESRLFSVQMIDNFLYNDCTLYPLHFHEYLYIVMMILYSAYHHLLQQIFWNTVDTKFFSKFDFTYVHVFVLTISRGKICKRGTFNLSMQCGK